MRLHALLDGQELDTQLGGSVEAHLIYMSEDEVLIQSKLKFLIPFLYASDELSLDYE